MVIGEYFPHNDQYQRWLNGEIDLEFEGIPPALKEQLMAEAMNLPASPAIEASGLYSPTLLFGFDSLDSNECCGGGILVPPDPEMAAGPNHLIAVVNVAIEIYDKSGNSLVGPVILSTFFSGLGGPCVSFPFDPNVLYDEEHDRFFIGADGNGESYCAAVSQTGDPTGSWNLYDFSNVDIGGLFFDYPHAGIGDDAIYMGANLFGSGRGYVYALDKAAMYANNTATILWHVLNNPHETPQPMNAHGWSDGTWPTGPHYFYAGRTFSNARNHELYSWNDPFGANTFTHVASFDLQAIHGVPVGVPINSPQQGGSGITGLDPRPLDFEYRNGSGWTVMGVSCNPGGGTVNCVQWAEVDLATQSIAQTDVYRTNGEYRYLPDIAADSCDQALVGYTKSSTTSYPGTWAAGPLTAGANPPETLIKAGDRSYYTYSNRWGDYTGMTIDPDGVTFWYLGEYSKNNGNPSTNWGDWIGSLTLDCSPAAAVAPSSLNSTQPVATTITQTLTISNTGTGSLNWTLTEAASGDCTSPGDISWLSASPSTGSTLSGGFTPVDVIFDSTGVATGGPYTGALCLNNNDLANPTITIPVSLIVESGDIYLPLTLSKATP
jgi:hypothetical protein